MLSVTEAELYRQKIKLVETIEKYIYYSPINGCTIQVYRLSKLKKGLKKKYDKIKNT